MIWWMVIAVILIILCGILLALEFFVPSFGLIFILAMCCLGGGIYIFFTASQTAGLAGIFISLVLVPLAFIIFYKILPHTGFGKSLTLEGPKKKTAEGIADSENLNNLLGKTAVTISPLRPVGMCSFENPGSVGIKLECVAESGYVEKGKTVKVIKVEGTQLTVREIETDKQI
ncbi:MAG: NfeD family protein [Phycisphaerales bacterium]